MSKLRICTYMGRYYFFHRWFQEGAFEGDMLHGEVVRVGSMDIGALLEDVEGNIKKVFQVADIKFKEEEA